MNMIDDFSGCCSSFYVLSNRGCGKTFYTLNSIYCRYQNMIDDVYVFSESAHISGEYKEITDQIYRLNKIKQIDQIKKSEGNKFIIIENIHVLTDKQYLLKIISECKKYNMVIVVDAVMDTFSSSIAEIIDYVVIGKTTSSSTIQSYYTKYVNPEYHNYEEFANIIMSIEGSQFVVFNEGKIKINKHTCEKKELLPKLYGKNIVNNEQSIFDKQLVERINNTIDELIKIRNEIKNRIN